VVEREVEDPNAEISRKEVRTGDVGENRFIDY